MLESYFPVLVFILIGVAFGVMPVVMGMIVAPCSMRSVSEIAYGNTTGLLTRAADVLVVCGALNKNHKDGRADEGSWYEFVHSALADDGGLSTKHKVPYSNDEVTRWRTPAFPPLAMERGTQPPAPEKAPEWLAQRWMESTAAPVRMRPSYLSRDAVRDGSQTGGGRTRGVLLHRLLQSLPELARAEREAAALRYLTEAAPELNDAARAKLLRPNWGWSASETRPWSRSRSVRLTWAQSGLAARVTL